MKKTIAFLAAITFCAVSSVYALYCVNDRGTWPDDWPQELEPLRVTPGGAQLRLLAAMTTKTDIAKIMLLRSAAVAQ